MSVSERISCAMQLAVSHPAAGPLAALDLAFEDHTLSDEEVSWLNEPGLPSAEMRAFLASAFDRGMTQEEWLNWQRPPADPQLQAAVASLWPQLVLPGFIARYQRRIPVAAPSQPLAMRAIRSM